ncbi:MAG: hypothetical protein H6662_10015 [Ardenticatenaceae bacterium]|nr:hypothetical protein [Anaerolineales bacterium]MCB8921910.1 hypothetical protein [Ardenticatenaceae bacterium]MCB8989485.1 hypothetical protein [Ardenticatenaceae bacterium]
MNKNLLIGFTLLGTLLITWLVNPVSATQTNTPTAGHWQIETVDASDCWFPSLALNDAGEPRISYGALGELKYAQHNGVSWELEFVEIQPGSTGWYSSLALDSDTPHISYYSPYSNSLMYAIYIDSSWQIQAIGDSYDYGGQTSLALDNGRLPHIAYWDATNLTIKYAYYDGADWQFEAVTTMSGSGQDVSLALTLDTANQPHLCYYDYENGSLKYASRNGVGWQFETVDNDVFYNGQDCDIALDAQNRPHIGYRNLALRYARRDGGSWQSTVVDDDFFAGDGLSLALDSAGQPHISYTDWPVPEHEVRYAFLAGGHWWIETVDAVPSGQSFAQTSLALDADDRPHIGYWQVGESSALKYAVRDAAPAINQVYLPVIVR